MSLSLDGNVVKGFAKAGTSFIDESKVAKQDPLIGKKIVDNVNSLNTYPVPDEPSVEMGTPGEQTITGVIELGGEKYIALGSYSDNLYKLSDIEQYIQNGG